MQVEKRWRIRKRGNRTTPPLSCQRPFWELHSAVIGLGFRGVLICGHCGVETDSGWYWLSDWTSLVSLHVNWQKYESLTSRKCPYEVLLHRHPAEFPPSLAKTHSISFFRKEKEGTSTNIKAYWGNFSDDHSKMWLKSGSIAFIGTT